MAKRKKTKAKKAGRNLRQDVAVAAIAERATHLPTPTQAELDKPRAAPVAPAPARRKRRSAKGAKVAVVVKLPKVAKKAVKKTVAKKSTAKRKRVWW